MHRRWRALVLTAIGFVPCGSGCALVLGDGFRVETDEETNGDGTTHTSSSCADQPDCNACGNCACPNEVAACNASSDCVYLLQCYSNPCVDGSCPACSEWSDPQSCYDICDGVWTEGVAAEQALGSCLASQCSAACSG